MNLRGAYGLYVPCEHDYINFIAHDLGFSSTENSLKLRAPTTFKLEGEVTSLSESSQREVGDFWEKLIVINRNIISRPCPNLVNSELICSGFFFIHNYLKDIYSMSHCYFLSTLTIGVLHASDFLYVHPPLFFF